MADAVGPSDAKVGIVAGSRRIKQRGSGYFKRKHSRHVPQDDDAVIGSEPIKSLGYWYVLSPVLTGAVILLLMALIVNNFSSNPRRHYPVYWF